tara:strand:- start:16561 stop:17067 length:507 start_codon:yes stop_codon:yes gene_type:complete
VKKLEKILIGIFSKPVGLKGEVKINLFNLNFDLFKNIKVYMNVDNSEKWLFNKITMRNNKCIVHPTVSNNRDEAEILKGKKIFTYKKYLNATTKNSYIPYDLMKCKIILNNGNIIGKVIAVQNFGAGDLLETNFENKNIYIPMNKENVVSVDTVKNIIIINPIKGILD